jgi:hypothetical protein
VTRPEYELPEVVGLKSKIDEIRRQSREEVVRLEGEIESERASPGYLHDLLTKSGDDLVAAVTTGLTTLGFQDVQDVDTDADRESSTPLREDLQIHDRSPLLLVEVKGIGGLPAESDALQVAKYVAPRMKELGRFDIQGLFIVNHQRHLPALDRQNTAPSQEDVLTNAQQQSLGLLTTWDLFRLIRNAIRHSWTSDVLVPILYRTGRIDPVPEHFRFAGRVVAVWPKADALGVLLETDLEVRAGKIVAVEGPVDFEVGEISSLRVEDVDQESVTGPGPFGLKTTMPIDSFRTGLRVFVADATRDAQEQP